LGGIEAGCRGDAAKPAPDVGSIERGASLGGENKARVLPAGSSEPTLGGLPLVLLV